MRALSLQRTILPICILLLLAPCAALADDLNENLTEAPPHELPNWLNAASAESDVANSDGTWTFSMRVDENSTPSNYYGPWPGYGFEIYSWYNGDYGWMHTFPHWNDANLNILSAKLIIHAWDIDSEPFHGYDGEYDGVYVDGSLLSPGYLQGYNNQWSTTTFDLPISTIIDDGVINVFLDIDMHHNQRWWATTLDFSYLEIIYSTIVNDPPYQPEVSWGYLGDVDCVTGGECITYGEGLLVEVVGPTPADPDDDAVTYEYRWFVDIGTGGFIDDEFAGRGDHTGNTVPATDIQPNDVWQVQIIPIDEHNAIGEQATATFPSFCTVECPFGCINGYVAADCPAVGTALLGVPVDVYEVGTGDLYASLVTDVNGYYEICDVPVEDYNVSVVTPLGYSANPDENLITVIGDDTVMVSFDLVCQGSFGSPRTIGFWKHQVAVATGGKGHAQVDAATLCNYLDLIEGHFNSNSVNQVLIYEPAAGSTCDEKILVAKGLLNLKGSVSMLARAKQQLMALLLNVAASKLQQMDVISDDGAVVSQAITHCDMLIDNGDPADDETAKTIADMINNNQMVLAGMIPLSTPIITYKGLMADHFTLSQNYPNPFNPITEIAFTLPNAAHVKLKVFNVVGQCVAVLADGELSAGPHVITWDGSEVASGVYLYRLQAGDYVDAKKMVLMK